MAFLDAVRSAPGFQAAWDRYIGLQGESNNYNPAAAEQDLSQYGQTFQNLFRNLVGRDPNGDELDSFYKTVVAPQGSFPGGAFAGQQELRDRSQSFITENFQRAAEDQAARELEAQQVEANRLADMFRQQGNQSLSVVEESLMDFGRRLEERIRPNLITSLQAQGLLNTGGLNQALAGQQGDIQRDINRTLLDQRLANEQQANAIAFSGASAPYEMKRSLAMNRIPYLQGQGENALTRAFQTRLNEQQYFNQLGLAREQARLASEGQPSFLKQLGGQILGNVFSNAARAGMNAFVPGGGMMQSGGGFPMAGGSSGMPIGLV